MSEGLRSLFARGEGEGEGDGHGIGPPGAERYYDHDDSLAIAGGDGCSYTKIRRNKCATQRNPETGKLVKKCEKTEELLRRCAGRPLEVVESKTEWTEEDVSSGAIIGQDDVHVFEETPLGWHRFFNDQDFNNPGGLPRLFENPHEISDQILGSLEDFLHSAEETATEFLHSAEETATEFLGQFGSLNAEQGKYSETFKSFINRFPDIFSKGEHLEKGEVDDSSLRSRDKGQATQHAPKFSDLSKDFKEV